MLTLRKPRWGDRLVNKASPQANGLVHWWPCTDMQSDNFTGAGSPTFLFRDAVGRDDISQNYGAGKAAGFKLNRSRGVPAFWSGAVSGLATPSTFTRTVSPPWSVSFFFELEVSPGSYPAVGQCGASVYFGLVAGAEFYGGGEFWTGYWFAENVVQHRTLTLDSSLNLRMYVDGILKETKSVTTRDLTYLVLGGGTYNCAGATSWDWRYYNRALSADEVKGIACNPYQLWRLPRYELFQESPASGNRRRRAILCGAAN